MIQQCFSRSRSSRAHGLALAVALVLALAAPAWAQRPPDVEHSAEMVQLDFADVELSAVIETIARLTGKNFIYDDRVRGRVTIVSPSKVTVEQAYAVFESVLQVKGFTTVPGPSGVIKVLPIREAKESSIETVRGGAPSPHRDHYVTRLIPLKYIDAQEISTTLKALVSKDAAMVAYAPTNTIILTDSASNIRRLLDILSSIDVSSYREDLAVIAIEFADASTLAQQISEIYGGSVSAPVSRASGRATARRAARGEPAAAAGGGSAPSIRIITDERTNSLIVLGPPAQIDDVRGLVAKLDVEVSGTGRIQVYYLKHADSEELAQTLQSLLTGTRSSAAGGAGAVGGAPPAPQALRSAVTELAEGVTLTADPATNSLVIQASKEAYETLAGVIKLLDIQRPQVLVEALIMEVDVTNSMELGFNWIVDFVGDWNVSVESITDSVTSGILSGGAGAGAPLLLQSSGTLGNCDPAVSGGTCTTIQSILRATATDGNTNVISAPHILTSDNEEAEIKVGNNIPIITQTISAAGDNPNGLATSNAVERQDIGVTLRVTPQISEGDTLRLTIFQEITDVNEALTNVVSGSDATDAGVALTSRRVENTLVVRDGETVVIGGLIGDGEQKSVTKIPWLGDIPWLGWLFKSVETSQTKTNLLVFLTPHIIRSGEDLEHASIRKREQFAQTSGEGPLEISEKEREEAEEAGLDVDWYGGSNLVRTALIEHRKRYPLTRMAEIERQRAEADVERRATARSRYQVRAGVFQDEIAATGMLTRLIEAGYDGSLVSAETHGALLFEIVLGPFDRLGDAEETSRELDARFDLESSLTVLSEDAP